MNVDELLSGKSNKYIDVNTVIMFIAGITSGFISGYMTIYSRPFRYQRKIDRWLGTEPFYIADYTKKNPKPGIFVFEIELSEEYGGKIIISNTSRASEIRIMGMVDFDLGLFMTLHEQEQLRRNLQTQIESVLTNTPGVFIYYGEDDNPCAFENARSLYLEYTIYPDGISQHEVLNGIMRIANAITYVEQREQQIHEEIRDGL